MSNTNMSTPSIPPPFYQIVGQLRDSDLQIRSTTVPLTLRLPTVGDVPTLAAILGNPANSELDGSVSDLDHAQLEEIARRWTNLSEPLTHLNFLIMKERVAKAENVGGGEHDPEAIGITGLGWIGPADENESSPDSNQVKAGAVGVMLEPCARGNGYAHETLRMVIDYGLRELGLAEIRVGTNSRNVPMKTLMMRKFGLGPLANPTGEVDKFGNDLLWKIKQADWLNPVNMNLK